MKKVKQTVKQLIKQSKLTNTRNSYKSECLQGNSNPCFRLERPVS